MNSETLDEIGQRHGTDKSSLINNYLFFYHRYFESLRRESDLRLLEIGVHEGGSLRMWEEYFPQATVIVGMDVNPKAKIHERGRMVVEIGDQSNSEHLLAIAGRHGPFDIIIDDGSHIWDHQILTLQTLFSFVKPGGFFVLEDLATSFGGYVPEYKGVTGIAPPVTYMTKLANYVTGAEISECANDQDAFLRTAAPLITSICFHRFTAIIERKR